MNLLAPIALWFAAVIPVVILFYLLKRKRVVRLVSSTVLWQRFLTDTQASAPFQKLRHNWLLVLQLLLLVLAVLALARPYFAGHVGRGALHVVILDSSASMQATDETPSRFERARTSALELVDSLRDTDQMIVLQAGGHAEVRQSATSDKAALRRALRACTVTDAATRLTEALKMAESLTRDNNDAEIHLFSDGAAPGLAELENRGLSLVYHRIGQRVDNAGIVSLDVRPNPEDANQRAVFALVANPSSQARPTQVELYFEDRLLEARPLDLPPTNSASVVFLAQQPRDGVFTVRLTTADDLAADNQASVVSLLPQPLKILLVSRGNRFLERALRAAGRVELTVAPTLAEADPPFDLVVLDNVQPAVFPVLNVLAIQTMNAGWFEGGAALEAPPIVDWKSTHPLLRFVSFDNVRIAKATGVKTPPWAASVVDSPQSGLILTGDWGRQRVIWIAFDLLDSDWPLRVSFPIFIANAVDWLNPASIQARQLSVPAGDPLRLTLGEAVANAQITRPDGATTTATIDPGARELVYGDTARQGIYRVTTGTNETVFAVNLLDAFETDVRPRAELDFGRFGEVKATTTRRASLEVWRWLAAAALAVLLSEWWYYHRRTA